MTTTLALIHNDKPIEELTEGEIAVMETKERVDIINTAQRYVASGGEITPEQGANLTRLLIYVRRRAVKDNPRASAAARKAVEVKPASLDDI